jgi:hypothetical protein
MRKIWITPLLLTLMGAALLTRVFAQQLDELDALKVAPEFQKLVFENALVRVSEERVPAGKATPKHRHSRGLTIAMTDYQVEQKIYPAGQVVHNIRKAGDINWTDGITHETRNEGTTNQYVVRIELK